MSKVAVSLDAALLVQLRAQLGAPAHALDDSALVERALSAYLLRRMVDATQASAGLDEHDAEHIAYEELAASRRAHRGGG